MWLENNCNHHNTNIEYNTEIVNEYKIKKFISFRGFFFRVMQWILTIKWKIILSSSIW